MIGEKDAPMLAKKPGAMWTPYIDEDDYTGLSATRLVKEGDALERLAGVRIIAFDKTGTLTYGNPCVISVKIISENFSENEVYDLPHPQKDFPSIRWGKQLCLPTSRD